MRITLKPIDPFIVLMILPHGSFHSTKKGVLLQEIMNDLSVTKFTGECMISEGQMTCLMVFLRGSCILAEYNNWKGAEALQEISSIKESYVDISLSTYTNAQVQLIFEFNEQERIRPLRNSSHDQTQEGSSSLGTKKRNDNLTKYQKDEADTFREDEKVVPFKEKGGFNFESVDKNHIKGAPTSTPLDEKEELDQYSLFHRDLDSLREPDVEMMAKRIHNNLKISVEKLNLGYLMEER